MDRKEEISIKVNRLIGIMNRRILDAIYLKRQDNFAWLTCGGINYVGLGEMGNCGLLVTRSGALYAITNRIEEARMRDEEQLEDMGFAIQAQTWYENAFEGEAIARLVPSGRVGRDHGLTDNVANDVKLSRFSLTKAEIERYKEGGYLTARAIEETISSIRPGDTELETVGRLAAATGWMSSPPCVPPTSASACTVIRSRPKGSFGSACSWAGTCATRA